MLQLILGLMDTLERRLGRTDVQPPLGEVTTDTILITLPNSPDSIRLLGFNDHHGLDDEPTDKRECKFVEVCDLSADSRGGIQTKHEPTAVLAARLACHLRQRGWQVVDRLDDFF